ncbi:precorrin-6x reductase [Thermoplasmatales archaeon BRNA1]|nr:precorrin-6x reductase [Thermoplasmatales archaeon BRNA1]
MKQVLVFAGTTEGGAISAYLDRAGVKVHACVATDYGTTSVPKGRNIEVSAHPLDPEEMRDLMREYPVVVDATHPYATSITGHIREACHDTGAEYIRIQRPSIPISGDDIREVKSIDEAVEFLKWTDGNILVTTGSKDLEKYTAIPNYKSRVFARVLSLPGVAQRCSELGFEGKNLFAMQGPFCEELDYGMLLQTKAKYLVTKDTGGPGGFAEKVCSARKAKATIVLVGRPPEKEGMTYDEATEYLAKKLDLLDVADASDFGAVGRRKMSLIGTGVGPGTGLTEAASAAVREADLVVGAERMLEIPEAIGKQQLKEYMPSRIFDYLNMHPEFRNIAVLLSGDVGFYSAARSILGTVDPKEFDTFAYCGISSVQYLCARAGIPWQDVRLVSAHGKGANIVGEVRRSPACFFLLNGKEGVKEMCAGLCEYGFSNVSVIVGSDLGYPEENFVFGTPQEVASAELGTLCAAVVLNPRCDRTNPISIPDSEFIRGDAPMTKSEVRALSVAKLKLSEDSVVYDVGAGTGSCSIEMARVAVEGTVYAIEKETEAADLIETNKKKFATPNVQVIRGLAPSALASLPAPTHVFIGGSSGNLDEIVMAVLEKNPNVRLVVNSVTLETISEVLRLPDKCAVEQLEVVCLNVATSRHLGHYNLMTAQNPVYIAVFRGKPL